MGALVALQNDDNAAVRNVGNIRDILKRSCNQSEIVILTTPYAKFECNFLWLDQDVFHVTATMTKEDALYGLKNPNLRIRFPYGHHIFSAPTLLAGIGQARGRKSLRLAIPSVLESDDFRRAYRVERVGRIPVTFSSRKYDLLVGNLINLSTGGARIYSSRNFEEGEIQIEDTIHVSIPLNAEINITTKAKVRHVKDRSVGLEFRPGLSGKLLETLSRWTFQKREEAMSQFASQELEGIQVQVNGGDMELPSNGEPMIALVGGTPELEQQIRPLLSDLAPIRRFSPNIQTMKSLAPLKNILVLFHAESAAHDAVKRYTSMLEPLQGKTPFILLSSSLDTPTMIGMGNNLQAAASCSLTGGLVLFPRVVAGVFRKFSKSS